MSHFQETDVVASEHAYVFFLASHIFFYVFYATLKRQNIAALYCRHEVHMYHEAGFFFLNAASAIGQNEYIK